MFGIEFSIFSLGTLVRTYYHFSHLFFSDNDDIIRSRIEARKQPSSILKNRDPSHNRHTQCKIFPKSTATEVLTPKKAHAKESSTVKNDALRAKGRVTALSDSRTRAAAQLKRMVPSWVQR